MKIINYSWSQFQKDAEEIANVYKRYKNLIANIYAIPRGGLPFGVVLSHSLGIPLILDSKRITSKTLVVDDIADSGKTLKKLLKDKKYFSVSVLCYSEQSLFVPLTFGFTKKQDEWILFPWETKTSSKYDKTKY